MSKLHRMARSGMKGRKKDTRVLTAVIAMSFLFLTVGTLLLSSLTESQARQRHSLYGSWQLLDDGSDIFLSQYLGEQDWITERYDLTTIGEDETCGAVAVWNDGFAQMGGLRLLDGRAPEGPGEIVLEKGQLTLFDEDISVGSTVEVQFRRALGGRAKMIPEELPDTMTIFGTEVEARAFYKRISYDVTAEDIERIISENWETLRAGEYWKTNAYGSNAYDDNGNLIYLPLFESEAPDNPGDMDEETCQIFLERVLNCEQFWRVFWDWNSPYQVSSSARVYHPTGAVGEVGWTVDASYGMDTMHRSGIDEEMLLKYGSVDDQTLTLTRTCTVVGILETTADRWDAGDARVPNSYISPETLAEFQEAVDYLRNDAQPPEQIFAASESVLNLSSVTFLRCDGSMSKIWDRLTQMKGNRMWPSSMEELYDTYGMMDGPLSEGMEADIRAQFGEVQAEGRYAGTEIKSVTLWDWFCDKVYFEKVLEEGEDYEALLAFYLTPYVRLELTNGAEVYMDGRVGRLYYSVQTGINEQGIPQYEVRNEEISAETLTRTDWAPEGYVGVGMFNATLEEVYQYNDQPIRINRYGFPIEGSLAGTMGATVIGVIVVITVCAVFQIFFTQIRRRTRKLTLLRSVGATSGQIFGLLFWEGLHITLVSVLLGDILGFGVAYLITQSIENTVFYMDKTLFLAGQLCGLLAVGISMVIPSLRAIRAPLAGRMEGKKRRHVKVKAMKQQTWHCLCARDRRSNPGRTVGTAALCIFLITMELTCVFLGAAAFDTYRETVVQTDRPDYTLTMNHAGSIRKHEELNEALTAVTGVERYDIYRRGENTFLWYDKMWESPVLEALNQVADVFFACSQSQYDAMNGEMALLTELYAVSTDSDLFRRLNTAITEGQIDPAAFGEGKEVIVLLPMYCPLSGVGEARGETMAEALASSGRMSLSLDRSAAGAWKKDTSLKVGDTITLGTDDFYFTETEPIYTQNLETATVGAIIRYFPDKGVWPFAGNVQSHVIIGGEKLMARLYGDGFRTYSTEEMQYLFSYSRSYFMPCQYGSACISLYAAQDAPMETTLSPISRVAREQVLTLRNDRDSNQAIYDKALSSCLLAGTLAFAATLIVWMILSNTLASAQEQSRKRTGILQALGITKEQYMRSQALQAVGYWVVTVVAANLLLALVVLISGLVGRAGQSLDLWTLLTVIIREDLAGYPWALHWALCALELPVLLLFHLRAARIPLKYTPVENIRS